jgi:fatty acid desaturase 2 (delta-6 desaturase)
VAYRLLEILLMTMGGYWLVQQGWYWTGMIILGITSGRCGWIQHEANHNSLTGVLKIDKFIGSFFFAVGEAGSATWWISSHNRHHASPQHLGYDADLNTLPAMAFDAITARMGKPVWLQFQAWTFEFSTWLVVFYWKVYLHPVAIWRKKALWDGLFLIGHYAIWYHYFSYMGIGGMIFSHLVWGSVAGMYLFTNFALSHTHKEVLIHADNEDWVRSAVLRTVNVKHSLLVNWWMGYLNMQIEHHLFPNMPQFRHPQIAARIKALCVKHNLQYDERGYWETCHAMFKNLHDVGHGSGVGKGLVHKLAESKQE